MHPAPNRIDLGRIVLRKIQPSDAAAMLECGSDPEVARYADWPLGTELEPIVERIETRLAQWEAGTEYYWVLTLPNDDRAIGGISCRIDGSSAEFGFLVNRHYWGNGYATAAARAVAEWAISLPTVSRVWATCDVDNIASMRVLEKAGLSSKGIYKRKIVRPNLSNEPRDALLFVLELSG